MATVTKRGGGGASNKGGEQEGVWSVGLPPFLWR
jgi:hypothetical protein